MGRRKGGREGRREQPRWKHSRKEKTMKKREEEVEEEGGGGGRMEVTTPLPREGWVGVGGTIS